MAGAALGLRLWHIEDRPIHTDEAVHAVILGDMLQTGAYRYNPHDSHGPTLYYLAYPFLRALGVHRLSDMEAWQLRLVPALIGAATILLCGCWARELGTITVWGAGACLALAAPFVYYQRYFIHESLFVLLSLLVIWTVWRFAVSGSWKSAAAMGLLAGLLSATKETAPLVLVALFLAGGPTWMTSPDRPTFPDLQRRVGGVLLAAALFAFTFVLFYTSFGTNAHGLSDAFQAIFRFAHRATGEGHEKPWRTYLAWIFQPGFYAVPWSGWIIGLLAGAGTYLRWHHPLVRLLAFYSLTTFLIYSAIPYKTPWLELNILAPVCLLAGVGTEVFYFRMKGKMRLIFYAAVAFALAALTRETVRLCFENPADARNPLAYSPTVGDIENLVQAVNAFSAAHDATHPPLIKVISEDYWPLPWYLRREARVGYWSQIPAHLDADIIITSPALAPELQARLGPGWNAQFFGLRSEVLAIVLFREGKK